MFRKYFSKPIGKGSKISPYMFLPHRIFYAFKIVILDPRYFAARMRNLYYQYRNPDLPWLTEDANDYLLNYVKPGMIGFEWGSGRSTVWFAKMGVKIYSVENNFEWYSKIVDQLTENRENIYYIGPADLPGEHLSNYVNKINEFPDCHFDFIIIDGKYRNECIKSAACKVKSNGIIVVDNADEDYDVTVLQEFSELKTTNGIWSTNIYMNDKSS